MRYNRIIDEAEGKVWVYAGDNRVGVGKMDKGGSWSGEKMVVKKSEGLGELLREYEQQNRYRGQYKDRGVIEILD